MFWQLFWYINFINMVEQKYFSFDDEQRMTQSETFEELAEIAIEILGRMPGEVGIVCGPISSGGKGTVEANIAEFGNRIEELKSQGLEIFDQMPFELHMWRIKETPYYDPTRNHLLEEFYGRLFASEKLTTFYFIPGWESSYGASWENNVARDLGKTIIYLK